MGSVLAMFVVIAVIHGISYACRKGKSKGDSNES